MASAVLQSFPKDQMDALYMTLVDMIVKGHLDKLLLS